MLLFRSLSSNPILLCSSVKPGSDCVDFVSRYFAYPENYKQVQWQRHTHNIFHPRCLVDRMRVELRRLRPRPSRSDRLQYCAANGQPTSFRPRASPQGFAAAFQQSAIQESMESTFCGSADRVLECSGVIWESGGRTDTPSGLPAHP